MKIIVSLTSYPPRIGCVHRVVESLFRQTVRADEIILYLSRDEFPDGEADLSDELRKLVGVNGFHIEWVRGNLKSHKKYYYAMQNYKKDIVITVDDDTVYAESMISDLMKTYQCFPHAVSARRVRIILKNGNVLEQYRKWDGYLDEYANMPRRDLCAIGVGGVLYPPERISSNWFDEEEIVKYASAQDDLWLKYNEILNDIPVVYSKPSQEDFMIENSQEGRLAANNLYSNGNDRCIDELLLLMQRKHLICYEIWMQGLMRREEYIRRKKAYYCNLIKTDLDEAGSIPFYLYGAGKAADFYLKILSDMQLINRVTAVIVSEQKDNPQKLEGVEVKQLNEIGRTAKFAVTFAVNGNNRKEIYNMLKKNGYQFMEINFREVGRYYLI